MYRDFGVGQMGDMGAHTMDLVWNAIDAGAPTAIEVDQEVSDKYNPDITPGEAEGALRASRQPLARAGRRWSGIRAELKPKSPKGYVDVTRIGNGAIFEGTKGSILADFTTRVIIPNNDDGDLTYYKHRGKEELLPLVRGTGNRPRIAASAPRGSPLRARASRPALRPMPSAAAGTRTAFPRSSS